MLRNLVLGFAALLAGVGAAGCLMGAPMAGPLVFGVLLLVGTLGERVTYKRLTRGAPGPGFVRTPERFVDDATGRPVTVWSDPSTGERAYVSD